MNIIKDGLRSGLPLILLNLHIKKNATWRCFFLFENCPWWLTHKKILPSLAVQRAKTDARGQINYPKQPFPLSSPSDTPEKSGPYQRPKGPTVGMLFSFILLTFHLFPFPQLLSPTPFLVIHFVFFFNPNSHHYSNLVWLSIWPIHPINEQIYPLCFCF